MPGRFNPVKIFACTASRYLGEKIAREYGTELGEYSILKFKDGELQPSIDESVRGCDVFIIQSTFSPAENLLELLLTIDAAKRASAHYIYVVIPYFGYARQDRKDKPRVSIGAKLIADLLHAAGASIASDLKWSAVKALLASLLAILLYVGFRFELKFATAGVVAIFHDILTVLGLFSILGGLFDFMPLEMDQSIIAAFLTIAGYSITDTVVVYDRIRERIRGQKPSDYERIFNESMNQTLSRTIITSGTVLLSVLVLFIFAGPAIRGFAFAVFIGILIGTYSSIFVAAPLVFDWLRLSKSPVHLRGSKVS